MATKVYIGVDASLASSGVAVLYVKAGAWQHKTFCIETTPQQPIGQRLQILHDRLTWIMGNVKKAAGAQRVVVGMEGPSFGAKFQRENMGMAYGLVHLLARRIFSASVIVITPRAVKVLACPTWPGWSKKAWAAAGRTTPYKMTMPPKGDVGSGLFKHFGINTKTEHEADAVCVALVCAAGAVEVKHGGGSKA